MARSIKITNEIALRFSNPSSGTLSHRNTSALDTCTWYSLQLLSRNKRLAITLFLAGGVRVNECVCPRGKI